MKEKRTQAVIKAEIENLRKDYQSSSLGYADFPEWIEATKAVQNARKKLDEIEIALKFKVREKREGVYAEIRKLEEELSSTKRQKLEIPENLDRWLNREYNSGVEYGVRLEFIWLSNNLKFGIIKVRGHAYWNGRGAPWTYGATRYWGVEIFGKPNESITEVIEGILDKETKQKLIDQMLTGTGKKGHGW